MASTNSIISIEHLAVRYGRVQAVDDVSLEIYEGECFALLGPNGAGKTSTLSVLEGLEAPAHGSVSVAGFDVRKEPTSVKHALGVQLQSNAYFPDLTAIELLQLTASFYRRFPSRRDARKQLERFGLGEKASARVAQMSGGQQQRLSLALALANDPRIVLLDEPTTGLDPQARRDVWRHIQELRAEGRTTILTTHYIEEAEMLSQRVGIMDHGKIIALDTPQALIARLGAASTLSVTLALTPAQLEEVRALPGVGAATYDGDRLDLQTSRPTETLMALQQLAVGAGQPLRDVNIRQPNLEDVFISLTGRAIRE